MTVFVVVSQSSSVLVTNQQSYRLISPTFLSPPLFLYCSFHCGFQRPALFFITSGKTRRTVKKKYRLSPLIHKSWWKTSLNDQNRPFLHTAPWISQQLLSSHGPSIQNVQLFKQMKMPRDFTIAV